MDLKLIFDLSFEFIFVVFLIATSFKLITLFCNKLNDKFILQKNINTISSFLPLFDKLLKFTVLFIILTSLLKYHGYSITTLIAGLGITGLAVGFAAQNSIANIFGSFSLLADKVFKIGDYIIINQDIQGKPVAGFIEDITLRSTKIRSDDGNLLIIPNNTIANCIVKNTNQKAKQNEN